MMYYEAAVGNNMVFENRSSGAYIFRPNVTHPNNFNDSSLQAYYIEGNFRLHPFIVLIISSHSMKNMNVDFRFRSSRHRGSCRN